MNWLKDLVLWGISRAGGTPLTPRRQVTNFVPGSGISISIADNPSLERSDVTIAATGGGFGSGTATAIHETSDPADLPVGAIPDGTFLVRSGSAVVGITYDQGNIVTGAGPVTSGRLPYFSGTSGRILGATGIGWNGTDLALNGAKIDGRLPATDGAALDGLVAGTLPTATQTVTANAYSTVAADAKRFTVLVDGTVVALTANSVSVAPCTLAYRQGGAGQIIVANGTATLIPTTGRSARSRAQGSWIFLEYETPTTFSMSGDLDA